MPTDRIALLEEITEELSPFLLAAKSELEKMERASDRFQDACNDLERAAEKLKELIKKIEKSLHQQKVKEASLLNDDLIAMHTDCLKRDVLPDQPDEFDRERDLTLEQEDHVLSVQHEDSLIEKNGN